jgi:hypothetical protein
VYIDTFYDNGSRIKSLSTKFSGLGKFIIGAPSITINWNQAYKVIP